MGDAYQFSESSLPLLDRCIQVASQPGIEWMALLKSNSSNTTPKKSKILNREDSISSIASTQIIDSEDYVTDIQMEDMSKQRNLPTEEEIENVRANLEIEPRQLDYLMAESGNYDNLLPVLAGKLSSTCVEAICEELFISRPSYIENFYVEFLAAYLKRDSGLSSLELLIKAREANPAAFKTLIITLLTNNSPILVLENFFTTIDNNERSQLLQALSTTKLCTEAFIQHMNSINFLYKHSQKTSEIQDFILNCLLLSAKACSKDKNYGKFLLTYLQALKESNESVNKYELEQLVKIHETSFARPCLTILNNYK